VAAAAALVLSACGGDGDSGGDAAEGDPVSGGSLSVIQMSEPRLLDPAVMSNALSQSAVVGNSLFGTLLTDKPDGTFDYGLAKSLETSDSGKTWKLTLRDGITFSDGTPMTAADVAYNWNRIKDPELGSQSRPVAIYFDELKPEGQVLTFTLTEPIANFGYAIAAYSTNWIAKTAALEEGQAAFDKNPIGAGPFTLKSWARGGKMVLVKNPKYYDDPKPYLDQLELTANGDEGQRFSTVESGGADATASSSAAHYKRGLENGLKGIKLDINGGIPEWMNTRIPPFDDPRAREAVAKAVDLEAVNAAAYEGVGVVPKTLFAEDSALYNDTPLTTLDKVGAQKLFDELADEGKPLSFMITAFQTSESRRVAEAFQASLSAYKNVKAEVEVLDFPAATAKGNAREFQMLVAGLAFSDPETVLYQNLHGSSAGNYSGINDPQMNAALEKGRLSSDVEERKAAYVTVAERFAATNPGILYTRYTNGMAYDPKATGFVQYGNSSTRVDGVWTTKN